MIDANLAVILKKQGDLPGAAAAYRDSIRLNPNGVEIHFNLANILSKQDNLPEAAAEYCAVIRIKSDYAPAYHNLGDVLRSLGDFEGAIASYRKTIELRPDDAECYCALGHSFLGKRDFSGALEAFRKGHELGSKDPRWDEPSADWVSQCEMLVQLEPRLPALLEAQQAPKDNAERMALALFCANIKRFAASARFWGEALADDPKLGEDRKAHHRYIAACSAVLAAAGRGNDEPKPDEAARAAFRARAREWLVEELAAWSKIGGSGRSEERSIVAKTMRLWKVEADLADVREVETLAKLPKDERQAWQLFWTEVDALLLETGK